MPDDEEIRASLRRLGSEPSTDGVLDLVTRRRDRLVRRRRAITVLATVAVVAIVGGSIAVAVGPDDPDRLVTDSPTTVPESTTTSTTSTSTTSTTSTSTTTTTPTTTTRPVDSTACTREAVAVSIGAPVEFVYDDPECVGGFALARVCDRAAAAASPEMPCPEGYTVLALDDGAWSIVGHSLTTCAEEIEGIVPGDIAVQFEPLEWCTWVRMLEGAVLEPGGLGPIRIGTTVSAIQAATGLAVEVSASEGVGGCRWADVQVDDVTLIVRAGVVVNITIYPNRRTDTGFGHGSSQDAVLQAYPDAEVQQNIWSLPNGLWISSPARDHPQAITYETDGTRVSAIQAGRHMPEGCHP